jgi:hypothetical protein
VVEVETPACNLPAIVPVRHRERSEAVSMAPGGDRFVATLLAMTSALARRAAT